MSVFEMAVEIVREDGSKFPGIQLYPDGEAAAKCNSAGVVVLGDERPLGDALRSKLVMPLAEFGYSVVAIDLSRGPIDRVAAIDDLVGALLTLRRGAFGRLGVVAVGIGASIALEAASSVPLIAAVAHIDGPPAPSTARLARVRASVEVHTVEPGSPWTTSDIANLKLDLERGGAPLNLYEYPAQPGFFLQPANDAEAFQSRIAWDRIRDFLTIALT